MKRFLRDYKKLNYLANRLQEEEQEIMESNVQQITQKYKRADEFLKQKNDEILKVLKIFTSNENTLFSHMKHHSCLHRYVN